MRPPELREPTVGAAGPDFAPPRDSVSRRYYRQDSRPASNGRPRLAHDDASLGKRLLGRACDDVRAEPSQLPLWAFRLYQHQRLGRLGYQSIWEALTDAGLEHGSDKWVRGCLLHAIGQANASTNAPPSMQTLLRGLI
jgi:hypothetical protein